MNYTKCFVLLYNDTSKPKMNKKYFITSILLFALIAAGNVAKGQNTALKTNLAYWGTATPNVGIEFKAGNRNSIEFAGGFNPFVFSGNRKFKHWLMQQEYRWWFCETYNKHYVGFHTHFGQYNVGGWDIPVGRLTTFKDNRYEGYLYGAGLSYGYQWVLNTRWGLEFNVGAGYARLDYDEFHKDSNGAPSASDFYDYWGVTKAGLSFVYFIK